MKRLILFVSIFGVGLLVLVVLLGPDRLWRRTKAPTIRSENLPASPGALPFSEQGQGRRIGVGMRGAFTLPLGWRSVKQADGTTQRFKVVQLKGANSEPYAGGIHLVKPVLEAFPGNADDEAPIRRVSATAGELETRGDLRTLTENFQAKRDLRSLTLGPDVRLEAYGEDGRVVMTLDTTRLEVPPTPEGVAGDVDPDFLFPRLVGPEPVHVFSTEPPFDLHAAGFTMLRFDGRLELAGPIDLVSGDLHVKSTGGATFVRRVEPGEAKGGSGRGEDAAGIEEGVQSIGPGTLTFERDVDVRQRDADGGERWMKTDVVALELARAEAPAAGATAPSTGAAAPASDAKGLVVKRVEAGGRDGTVEFGLLGGTGVARHVTRDGDAITLEGPLHLDGLAVGEGGDARIVSLRAKTRLELTPLAAADGTPARWRAVLSGDAHATSVAAGDSHAASGAVGETIDADADTITAVLVARGAPAKGGAAPTSGLDLESLGLDGSARVDLHGRGKARAQKITLESGGQQAHLEGDAEVVTERGTLRGPVIDLDTPKGAPLHVIVPVLAPSDLALPPGTAWFGTAASDATAPGIERRIELEPIAPARLEIRGDEMHVKGRTRVRVFELPAAPDGGAEKKKIEIVRLAADQIDVWPVADGATAKGGATKTPPQIEATGDVDAFDFRDDDPDGPGPHLHLLAAHARTEFRPDGSGGGERHLLLDGVPGTPAVGTLPVELDAVLGSSSKERASLTIAAAHLDFDIDTRRIVADDGAQRVAATIPESLVAPVLPPGFGELPGAADKNKGALDPAALAALKPLRFYAEHVEITPPQPGEPKPAGPEPKLLQGLPATSPFARALVTAHGRIHAERPSDRSSFDALTLRFDLARGLAHIAGSAEQPVVLQRTRADLEGAVDRIVTEWIDVSPTREGRPRIQLHARKDLPVVVLYPSRPSEDGKPPRRLRVELSCSDPPELVDQHLLLTGGVDTWIFDEAAEAAAAPRGPFTAAPRPAEPDRAHIRSERVELILSRPIGERVAGEAGPALVRLSAQGRVHLDYGEYHAVGALLTYEFAGSELVLKQGAERCQMLAADADGAWHATADFQRLSIAPVEAALRPRSDPDRLVRAHFEDFRLLLEAPNGR